MRDLVWGICMVKDEADIIGYTIPRMAAQLDGVIVANNGSCDGTRAILEECASRLENITIVEDPEVAYFQSRKMTDLAWRARSLGAEWVVPFDADEVWHTPLGPLRDVLSALHEAVLEATLYDHVASADDDEGEPDPVLRIRRRRVRPLALPKVACRVLPGLTIEQGNHGARYPGVAARTTRDVTVRHYPYRSSAQMARKARNGAAAYAAAGDALPASTGQHWRDYGRFLAQGGEAAIEEIFKTWFYIADPTTDGTTVMYPCPVRMPT